MGKDLRSTYIASGPTAVVEHASAAEEWQAAGPVPEEVDKRFPTVCIDDLAPSLDAKDFVEGLLTDGSASVVYGPSNCGKTFWILDVAVHVASGKAWRNGEHEVEQGAVVYFALEGTFGIKNRVEAMRRERILMPGMPFYLCFAAASLMDGDHREKLINTVQEVSGTCGVPVRLIVIDTLARAMAGGDENSGQDMTFAIAAIDALRAATGAHVAAVHHCGKDEARGARGHSSLRAAVDTEIEISRAEGEDVSTVRVTKQRDLDRGFPMPFSLKVVELGTDRRGKAVTSCVVKHEDEMMASSPKKSGRKPKYAAEMILEYLPADTVEAWKQAAMAGTGMSRATFFDLKNELYTQRAFRQEVGTGRLVCKS